MPSEWWYDVNGAMHPYKQIVAPMPSEWWYDWSRAVLPYNQIVASTPCERLYGGVREKSIGYPRKVYRVFPESL